MNKLLCLFSALTIITSLTFVGCEKDEKLPVITTSKNKYVNDWIYENMATYYLWNTKIPATTDVTLSPDEYFKSLLYTYDANSAPDGDRFSWIQENYVDLLNSLSGVVAYEIGFEYVRVKVSSTSDQYYLLVLYPKYGTDAYSKGVRKGMFVTQINNTDITLSNLSTLVGGTSNKALTIAEWVLNESTNTYSLKETRSITVSVHKDFAENPVYMDSVYTLPSGKKVGYLVYHFFANDSGDGTYAYDKNLMEALTRIKSQGVSDLVLDLRYNSGGAVSSAVALSSALVPDRSTSNVFQSVEYNSLINDYYVQQYGSGFNKTYFRETTGKNNEISIPQMNLSSLYVLTSSWTASASEMVINGLKPYTNLNIVLVGDVTVGKNVGSISIYEENDENNKWGMQPIIAKYYNSAGKSDFTGGFIPDYEVDEFKDLLLVDFGDTNDIMLGKALEVINGAPFAVKAKKAPAVSDKLQLKMIENSQSILEKVGRNILNDDTRDDELRSLLKK